MLGWSRGRRRFRLLQEALLGRLVAGQIGRQDLDRHLAVEARVVRGVDDAHAAVAKFGAEGVRTDGGAGGPGHERTGLYP